MPAISHVQDKLAIRELIENWAVWRDSFQWDRFRTVWHPEGRMWATWFQGTYEEFIAANLRRLQAKGVRIYHFLGGSSIDIKGKRAIAQTKMSISQRAKVEGVECDVLCIGRFYDFLEKRKGQWGLVWRRLTYEKDQIVPVDPEQGAEARPEAARPLPRRLPPPRLSADQGGLQGEGGHAGRRWAGDRQALRARARTGSRAARRSAGDALRHPARSIEMTAISRRGNACRGPTNSTC